MNNLGRRLKDGVWSVVETTRAYRVLRPWYGGIGTILMFHRVVPEDRCSPLRENRELEVTPADLEAVIRRFRDAGYRFVSLDDVHRDITGPPGIEKFVAFTFDDGYADNLTAALPILRRHGVPMALYLTTSFPEGTACLWWYLFEEILLENRAVELPGGETLPATTPAEKNDAFSRMKAAYLATGDGAREAFLTDLFRRYRKSSTSRTASLALTWNQLETLAADPLVTIGAHTLTHPALSRLSAGEARREMEESRDKIHERLGIEVRHFCYPFGSEDTAGPREFRLAEELGFLTATTTRLGNIFPEHRSRLSSLPRVPVYGGGSVLWEMDKRWCGLPLARARRSPMVG